MHKEPEKQPKHRLWTIPQAAEYTTLSPRWIWAKIAARELTAVRLGRRATRVLAEEIEALVERARQRGAQ